MTITRRTALIAAASATLAGCGPTKPIVLDREAMVGIKRIGLPVAGVLRSPDVNVVNGISERVAGLGLIGAIASISGSVVRGNRSDALARMMGARDFDPGPALTAMLAADLGANGFIVVPMEADPKRRVPVAVTGSAACDAVLDCFVSTYGFTALNDADDSPYRATVVVPTRLARRDGTVLMQDAVVISAGETTDKTNPGVTAPGTFRSFSDVEKDPVAAVDALRAAFEAAAAGVVRRMG